jgi:hypothetical protein
LEDKKTKINNMEEELLKEIKSVLAVNNDAQAIRMLEQYGHAIHLTELTRSQIDNINIKKTNMTDAEMEKIAELIFQKIVAKQEEWDKEFDTDTVYTLSDIDGKLKLEPVDKDMLARETLEAELKMLKALRKSYIEAEKYEQLIDLQEKINDIKEKLKK